MVNFVITPSDVFQLSFLALFGIFFLVFFIIQTAKKTYIWSKTGFCLHEWKLYETFSYGSKSRYRCEKCGSKSVRV
jgi:hypothetical protein